ncbi:MAG: hypothetical protein WC873_00410 [Candidatus Gracilibacteria bacterium]
MTDLQKIGIGTTFEVFRRGDAVEKHPINPNLNVGTVAQRQAAMRANLLAHFERFPGLNIHLPESRLVDQHLEQPYVTDFVPFAKMSDADLENLRLGTRLSIMALLMFDGNLDIFGFDDIDPESNNGFPPLIQRGLNASGRVIKTLNPRYSTNFGVAGDTLCGIDVDNYDREERSPARQVAATVLKPAMKLFTSKFKKGLLTSTISCEQLEQCFENGDSLVGMEEAVVELIASIGKRKEKEQLIVALINYGFKESRRSGMISVYKNADTKILELKQKSGSPVEKLKEFIAYLNSVEVRYPPRESESLVAILQTLMDLAYAQLGITINIGEMRDMITKISNEMLFGEDHAISLIKGTIYTKYPFIPLKDADIRATMTWQTLQSDIQWLVRNAHRMFDVQIASAA